MALWSNYMTAIRNATSAFRFTLRNPGDSVANDLYSDRLRQYALGWNAYTNQAFSALSGYQDYARGSGLYEKTRAIYNPATVIVDFYASHVYQGVLTDDGMTLPDGEQLAIPISRDASPELKAAIAQLWQWGNWQQHMSLGVMYGAAMGDMFVEGVENIEKGRVWPQVIPPPHIKEIEFDERGNVTYYEKEYSFYSRADKRAYIYTKRVSKERIETLRDNQPFDYGGGAVYDNPFGFVPLVHNAHRNLGTLPGAPAMRNWSKIEACNSLASRVDAYIRVQSQSPQLISGTGKITAAESDARKTSENDLKLLKVDGDVTVHQLTGNLDIAAAEKRIESMLTEIEHDHPEATMYAQLRSMGEVTGPAAERLMGDVRGYVQRARAGYDDATRRILQMCVSMAAMRVRDGFEGWQNPSAQQQKFTPFALDSYERGDIDFSIEPRPLIPMTSFERWQLKAAQYDAMRKGVDVGIPLDYQMQQDGVSEDELARMAEMRMMAERQQFSDGFMPLPA